MKKFRISCFCLIFSQCCFAQHWQALSGGLNQNVSAMTFDSVSNELFVGGTFTRAGNDTIWGIANWNVNHWDSLAHGIDDASFTSSPAYTHAIVRYGNYIYVGGAFSKAGNLNTYAFARWNGLMWDSVPNGKIHPYHVVNDMMVHNNELYICGDFDTVGNLPCNGIAKWNGVAWQTIGNSFNFLAQGYLTKMAFYNGSLFVEGNFLDPAGHTCYIAKWNGSNWQFFPNPIGGFVWLTDLEVYNNQLYVSGNFYTSDGNAGTSIMSWNDTVWSAVGGSVQIVSNNYPTIKDMCVHNGKLFCVGNFEKIGGIPANGMASWDGTQWCGFNTAFTVNNLVNSGAGKIAFYGDTMYVAGDFLYADGDTVNHIAKWIAGNYTDTCGFISTGIVGYAHQDFFIHIFPNPSTTNTTFQIERLEGNKTLIIYDELGKEIWRKDTNEDEIELSVENFSAGLYFYRVQQNGELKANGKLIIE